MRYLKNPNKLIFDRAYSKSAGTGGALAPHLEFNGLSIRGGQVLVTRYPRHHDLDDNNEEQYPPYHHRHFRRRHHHLHSRDDVRSVIFSTDRSLESGVVHCAIVKYSCFCEGGSLGSIGLLRHQKQEDGSPVVWQISWKVDETLHNEEHVFGMEYDASRKTLRIYKKNGKTNKMEPHNGTDGTPFSVNNELGGKIYFAASLSSESVAIKGNQLSIRSCDEAEWSTFLAHTAERSTIRRMRGLGRHMEERMMRLLDRRAMREIENDGIPAWMQMQDERMMDMMEHEIELNDSDSDNDGEIHV